jgi:hypothetical protein
VEATLLSHGWQVLEEDDAEALLSQGCGVQLSAFDEGATLLSHGCGVQLSGYVGDDIELASQGGI